MLLVRANSYFHFRKIASLWPVVCSNQLHKMYQDILKTKKCAFFVDVILLRSGHEHVPANPVAICSVVRT